MSSSGLTYAQLEESFIAWAEGQAAIRGAVVVGSRAGPDASEWSDLDVVIFTTSPGAYGAQQDWLAQMGAVWLAVPGRTGRGDPEWKVLYDNGLKVDYVLTRGDQGDNLAAQLANSPYHHVYQHGLRPLLDKNGPLYAALATPGETPAHRREAAWAPPSDEAYQALVEAALFNAAQAGRWLRRGELWRAKQACDCALKEHLLAVLVWRARLAPVEQLTAWDDGRRLDSWADARALAALPATFAAYDGPDIWRALMATLDLFVTIAAETAWLGGYTFPEAAAEQVTAWLAAARDGQD